MGAIGITIYSPYSITTHIERRILAVQISSLLTTLVCRNSFVMFSLPHFTKHQNNYNLI